MLVSKRSVPLLTSLALAGGLLIAPTAFAKKNKNKNANCDVMLSQSDFADGTYIIGSSGTYCLAENISFNPNNAEYLRNKFGNPAITAYEASMPLPSQLGMGPGQYDPSAFGLGFFAAIAVASPDVVIDLKGKTLEQNEEHALLQRFYANIETADRPFIFGQGPSDFGTIAGAAENLVIKNGTIGRSSHHGVHGNRSKNVTIENIKFKNFEVAAVSMNGVQGLTMKNLRAKSRRDLPILGQYSTAQFIKPYVDFLVYSGSSITFNGKSAAQIQAALKSAVNNVHSDLILKKRRTINKRKHAAEWALFHNKFRVVDGNAYGFLVNGDGVAVNGFPQQASTATPSEDITIQNVHVDYLKANIREIVGIAALGSTAKASNDPVGSLFQLLALDPRGNPLAMTDASPAGSYVGNVVTDAQALVAKATHAGEFPGFLDTTRNSISPALVAWAESGAPLSTYLASTPGPHGTGFVCNGDQMFHVNKGVVAFKLDGTTDISLRNASAKNVINTGDEGSTLCGDYAISHAAATLEGYGGAITRGMSISGSSNVTINKFRTTRIVSEDGTAIGIDVLTDSEDVLLKDVRAINTRASRTATSAPTAAPEAIGFRISSEASNVTLNKYCARALNAYDNAEEIAQDNSGAATLIGGCK